MTYEQAYESAVERVLDAAHEIEWRREPHHFEEMADDLVTYTAVRRGVLSGMRVA